MSPGKALLLLVLALAAVALFAFSRPRPAETIFEPPALQPEAASPVPWRDAETDQREWFPGATGHIIHDVILSGQRAELQRRLGRPLLPEEHALHMFLVASNETHLGSVLTRRIKGPSGAVEIALALNPQGRITNFKVQRLREPPEITTALAEFRLDDAFRGLAAADQITLPAGPEPARALAEEIARNVQALLVLYQAAESGFSAHRHH